MGRSLRTRLAVVALGLSLSGLGIDRLLFSGGDGAGESPVAGVLAGVALAAAAGTAAVGPAPADAALAAAAAGPPLSQLLDALAQQHGLRPGEGSPDVFIRVASALRPNGPSGARPEASRALGAPANTEQAAAPPAAPLPRLSGMLRSRGGGVAVLNGKAVRVGDDAGEYRLIAVNDTGVVLLGPSGQHVLPLRR